jgi:HD-GYP domain-containing protein (c-di-GMP phosphodiesterase class II)
MRSNIFTPLGTTGPPVAASDIQKVFTAPVTASSLRGMYLTVAFSTAPERATHDLLAVLLGHLQLVIEHSLERGASSILRAKIAMKIIEPDLTTYPTLRRHGLAVASLTEAFVQHLRLPPADAENARLVALVHDAGMRLLDYETLYRKSKLTDEERTILREHVSVGAALVEPLLGNEIARAVLCHHERADGGGYPSELRGEEIPLLSRVVQLCDAWVAMTDPESYQPACAPELALPEIRNGAGTQFDPELARRFLEMMQRA